MSLEALTTQLKVSFEAKDFAKVEDLITPIKILLISNDLLIPNQSKFNDKNYIADLIISRSILEISAFSFINLQKFNKFENILNQLKVFYFNKNQELSKSSKKSKLLSLYLLLLLSTGEFVQFYTELEYYNSNGNIDQENDQYLKYPINLANWLIEGYYDKSFQILLEQQRDLKLKEFSIFNDILLRITRVEIGKSLNKSYGKSLSLENVKNLLYIKDSNELNELVEEFDWKLNNGEIIFNNEKNEEFDIEDDGLSNGEKLIKNSLNFAKEIDSIV